MTQKINPLDNAAESLAQGAISKNNISRTSIKSSSVTELIDPRYRVHGPPKLPPHQYSHTLIPQKDASSRPLPPHEFTKSRVRTHPPEQKNQSYVEWIPYQRKIVEFRDESRVEKVPRTKHIQQFKEEVVYDEVARQAVKLDYYAVEKVKKYVPVQYEEKQIIMVEKMVPCKKTIYVPTTRQVYHGPQPGMLPIYDQGYSIGEIGGLPQAGGFVQQPMPNYQQPPAIPNYQQHSNPIPIPSHHSQQAFNPAPMTGTNISNRMNSTSLLRKSMNRTSFASHANDTYESYIPSFRY